MVEQRVLAVDDDPAALEAIVTLLREDGYEVHTASCAEDAEVLVQRFVFPLVVTDLILPGKSGIDLVRYASEIQPGISSIVVTGHGTLRTAVEALQAGAVDYLTKPIDPGQLRTLISRILQHPPHPHAERTRMLAAEAIEMEGMVSRSPAMRAVFDKIALAAGTESTILLQGESGTGKELCARAIHRRSAASTGAFFALPAGALPQERIAEELFGSESDSTARRLGKIEQAQAGTLFIDEVDALDGPLQLALLRVMETGRFLPLHGKKERTANLRLIVSTHRSLADLVRDGRFREDLYYRLSIFPIVLPPLRDRRDDIPLLVQSFLDLFSARYRKAIPAVPQPTMDLLLRYAWPGNVRELRNVVEHAVILCMDGRLEPEFLPRMLHAEGMPHESIRIPIGTKMKEVERTVIARTLDAYSWNKNKTAKILGISRRSLYNKLDRYQITRAQSEVAVLSPPSLGNQNAAQGDPPSRAEGER